jgi:pectate lyase
MALYMKRRLGLALVSGLLLAAHCGDPSDGDPTGGGGSQSSGGGAGRSGAGGANGGTGGGQAGRGGTGTSGSSGAGGSAGKGGSGGSGGTAGASGAGGSGTGGSAGSGTGGTGPVDGGGGVGGTPDGGGSDAPGGSAGSGGSGGLADAGRDAVGGSAGSGGAAGGKDGGAGKSGAAGQGGSSGAGGGTVDSGPPSTCPTALVGWATVSGDGVTATTGGGNAAPVRPTTAAELMAYASDTSARVIEIVGTFSVPRLDVLSNKTLVGIGNNATINGGVRIRGYADDVVQNVILRNVHINGLTTTVDNDALQIYFAHHVWIDHCDVWDGPDGNMDMSHAVNWVTVSWTKFRYTTAYQRPSGETSDHRFSSLLGHSDDNAAEDTGRLKVSFHHNWWAERVIERMPRVRFGQVHVFNNYFASPGNNYCVRAGSYGQLLIEGNYFDAVNSPHEFNDATDEMTASITARNNTYNNTTGNQVTGGGGTPFTSVPYSATIEPAGGIPTLVQACAGPR